jgi:hypothetical protein
LGTYLLGHFEKPGANPIIASYNASAVKIYNATSSLVHFENENVFFYLGMLNVS